MYLGKVMHICVCEMGERGTLLKVYKVVRLHLWLWYPEVDTELCSIFLSFILFYLVVCVYYKTKLHLHRLERVKL